MCKRQLEYIVPHTCRLLSWKDWDYSFFKPMVWPGFILVRRRCSWSVCKKISFYFDVSSMLLNAIRLFVIHLRFPPLSFSSTMVLTWLHLLPIFCSLFWLQFLSALTSQRTLTHPWTSMNLGCYLFCTHVVVLVSTSVLACVPSPVLVCLLSCGFVNLLLLRV